MDEPNIILTGMMGSGKTTTGKLLALHLGKEFVDTDEELVAAAGLSIPEIFRLKGEAGFRQLEAETVARIARRRGQVIATGGGVVVNPANIEVLKQSGIIIFLAAPPAVLAERLRGDTSRPLLQEADPLAKLSELLARRLPLYRGAAAYEISTAGRTPEEVAGVIVHYLQNRD